MSINTLESSTFTEDEQTQIVTDLLALKKAQIRDFLSRCGLRKSGTKEDMQSRILDALKDGSASLAKIVRFLDEVVPWGKQHVFLYKGPRGPIENWKQTECLANLLDQHGLGEFLNASLPLVLPESMKVSSILHDENRLRVTAIKKREWWERNPDYDDTAVTGQGDDVALRAFILRVTRSLVAFEWDLNANTAFLQVSQLPTGFRYEIVAQEFFDLVAGWFDIQQFSIVDLRPAIKKLHELEEARKGETRSHGINYRTLQGRRFEGKSASASDPLLGEVAIDAALSAIRDTGVGHLGNFYWLPTLSTNPIANPLHADVHVIVVGSQGRLNFPTPNDERTLRYVLSRIRSYCS